MLSEFPKVTLRERKGQSGCPHQGTRGTRIEKDAGRQSMFGPPRCCCVRTFPKHPDASWRLFLTKPPTCTISILCKLCKFAFVRHSLPRFSRMLFMACLYLRMCKEFYKLHLHRITDASNLTLRSLSLQMKEGENTSPLNMNCHKLILSITHLIL